MAVCQSAMDFHRGEPEVSHHTASSLALYRGHISGHRLRGVKINPIYQENEIGRDGSYDDTQSENSILVGEIQIDMYESLPRQRKIRAYKSDPSLLNTSVDRGSGEGFYNCSGLTGPDGEDIFGAQALKFSHFTLPSTSALTNNDRSGTSGPSSEKQHGQPSLDSECNVAFEAETRGVAPFDKPKRRSGGYLLRQARINGVSDDPEDGVVLGDSHASYSKGSQHSSTSSQSSCNYVDSSAKEHCDSDHNRASVEDVNEIMDEMVTEIEARHVTESGSENGGHDSLSPKSIEYSDRLPTALSQTDVRLLDLKSLSKDSFQTTEEMSNEVSRVGYVLQRSPAYYCLDAIAKLPTHSDHHYIRSICPTDYLNNNHVMIPDQMLIMPKTSSMGKDEIPFTDSESLKVANTISHEGSMEMEFQSRNDSPPVKNNICSHKDSLPLCSSCSCNGRPSIKCACGRLALEKLLKQKHMIADGDSANEIRLFSATSEGTPKKSCVKNSNSKLREKSKLCDDIQKSPLKGNPKNCNNNISGTTQHSPSIKNGNIPSTPQHKVNDKNNFLNNRADDRTVTFGNATIFNDYQRQYDNINNINNNSNNSNMEGGVTSSPVHSYSSGEYQGHDNPVFICDESGQLHEIPMEDYQSIRKALAREFSSEKDNTKKSKGKGKNNKNNKNNQQQINESILMNCRDLNAPAYLDGYLNGINGGFDVTPKKSKKAAPVSIEAVGVTVFSGFDGITEASDDEFQYNRRRRKHKYDDDFDGDEWVKKMKRPKKIKIGVAIFLVIGLIIGGIALGIHFGPEPSNATLTMSTSKTPGRDFRQDFKDGLPTGMMSPF